MTAYSAEHASALADLEAAGAAVTFTRDVPGTLDPLTETWSGGSTETVTGYALEVKGETLQDRGTQHHAGEMVQAQPATLLFCPTTYGDLPELESRVTWGGVVRVVQRVTPLRPDGTAVLAKVVVL